MMPSLAVLVALVAAPAVAPALSPDSSRLITQYKVTRWVDTDGLPQNSINAVAQTSDRFLWLASEEGLIRFDGRQFVVHDAGNTPALTSSQTLSLAPTRDGGLWVGTAGAGLLFVRGGAFRSWTTEQGLPAQRVQAVAVDSTGVVWAGTARGLVWLDMADPAGVLHAVRGLPAEEVSVLVAAHGAVWVGTRAGLARIEGGVVQVFGTAAGLTNAEVRTIAPARDGGVWIGTNGGGIQHFDGVRFRALDARIAAETVTSIVEDEGGAIWFGTNGNGLRRLHGNRLESLGNRSGGADLVWSLLRDAEGSLWIGSNGRGLLHLRETPFVPFGEAEGLSGDIALAVLQARDGSRWVGTAGAGLNRIDAQGRVTQYGPADGIDARMILSLAELPGGDLLIGSRNGSLTHLRGGRFTEIGSALGLRHSVMAILADAGGGYWLGTTGGVRHVSGGRSTTFTTADGLADDFVLALHRARDGALWVGTRGGVSRIVDGRVVASAAGHPLDGTPVAAFFEPGDGSVWLATQGRGIARIAGAAITFLDRSAGLCEDLIHALVEDGGGHVWLSSNKGVFRLRRAELDAFFERRADGVECRLYDTGEGMRSREANGGFMPAAARLADGSLVFPTMQGIVTIDPARIAAAPAAPAPVLESAVVGQDTVRLLATSRLDVTDQSRSIAIHFTSPAFHAASRLRFRFRLDGFDRDWQDAGTRRVAFYTNLPPGDYAFRVAVANEGGEWREAAAPLRVVVPARFHETIWFYLLWGVAGCVLLFVLHRFRVRTMQRSATRLSALVAERTRAEERYRDLFENASDMVFTTDPDGRVMSWNAQARLLTGCATDEVVGRHIGSVLPEIGDIADLSRRDITFTTRGGEDAAVEITTRAISDRGRPAGYQVIGRDVHEWRMMQTRLEQAAKMEAVGRLAGGIAHDFNNLLTVITSYSDILDTDLPLDSGLRDDVDQIRAAADRAADLTRQLLAFSRRQVLQPRVLSVNRKAENVIGMLRRIMGVDITLETVFADDVWPVHADAGQLEQVLMNLALNARDAMPHGGTLRIGTANLEADADSADQLGLEPGRYVQLIIEDTGTGIDAAALPHIFEPFFTTKEAGRGTGLGLAMVYGVVKQSGGHIAVDSTLGRGTRFRIYLPAAARAEAVAPPAVRAEPPEFGAAAAVTILLVEDEPAVRGLAAKILTRRGFTVVSAADGQEALNILESGPAVDLLLTDIVMPGMSGRELALQVHARWPDMGILYMSGYTEDDAIRRGVLAEGERFIGKPFTPAALVDAVGGALTGTACHAA